MRELDKIEHFKSYGFEAPDFEAEILKEVNGFYIGYVIGDDIGVWSCKWNKKGYEWDGLIRNNEKYSLKPIKKEWYELEENFPCLVFDKFTLRLAIAIAFENNTFNLNYDIRTLSEIRLATDEEIDSLKVKL